MNENMGEENREPGNKVCSSWSGSRARTSYIQFCGVVGGIVGSLIGYTFFDVLGALVGGFLGIVACGLAARMILQPK